MKARTKTHVAIAKLCNAGGSGEFVAVDWLGDMPAEGVEVKLYTDSVRDDLVAALESCLVFVDIHRHKSGGDGDLCAAEARAALATASGES